MLELIVFDFDGTLADTIPVLVGSFNAVFQKYASRPITREEVFSHFGPSEPILFRKIFGHTHPNMDEIIEYYFEHYEGLHQKLVSPDPGIISLLTLLKNNNVKLGILTGKGRRSLDISLRLLNMTDYFVHTLSGDEIVQHKPDPFGILEIMERTGTKKENTMFVGDSDIDIGAGKAAGVETIGALWMENSQVKSFAVEPDKTFHQINDFIDLIKERVN